MISPGVIAVDNCSIFDKPAVGTLIIDIKNRTIEPFGGIPVLPGEEYTIVLNLTAHGTLCEVKGNISISTP